MIVTKLVTKSKNGMDTRDIAQQAAFTLPMVVKKVDLISIITSS